MKFKNLRTYFLNQHHKIRDAPSGSAGCPGVKWPLYDAASFLLDAQVDQTPIKSTFVLPSTMGEPSNVGIVSPPRKKGEVIETREAMSTV
ncbi:hypothetical protein E2C01_036748 [Portunus trituberculatus]|uniref:Uncharacterized protein n=1 Tax=Portunus trituberculatus TaxID=210409 RepID=A0A5B7F7I8_PORTR|nr:hypothetical protein [Portunus trituberculatus]